MSFLLSYMPCGSFNPLLFYSPSFLMFFKLFSLLQRLGPSTLGCKVIYLITVSPSLMTLLIRAKGLDWTASVYVSSRLTEACCTLLPDTVHCVVAPGDTDSASSIPLDERFMLGIRTNLCSHACNAGALPWSYPWVPLGKHFKRIIFQVPKPQYRK